MQDDNYVTATTGAAFLSAFSKTVNQWSMLVALATLLILGLKQSGVFLWLSLLIALLQAFFAARCAFDAAVFSALRGDLKQYEGFDNLLIRWQLRGPNSNSRSLDDRVNGAIRLLRWQTVCFAFQILSLAAGLSLI